VAAGCGLRDRGPREWGGPAGVLHACRRQHPELTAQHPELTANRRRRPGRQPARFATTPGHQKGAAETTATVSRMDYTHLGRSGVSVSRICLGTMNFGAYTEPADAFTIMDYALEQGVNFFDTANTYGRPRAEGVTESIIGDWFEADTTRRDKVVLATKLYGGLGEWPNDRFLSAVNIRQACEASLRRLKTDRIDLYQMHHVDRRTPWDEIWEAFSVLRQQGKVIYFGSSNFAGWHIAQAQEAARRHGAFGLVSEQSLYNLAARTVELEVLPACQGYGLGVIPWSPLHGGLLSGLLARQENTRQENMRQENMRQENMRQNDSGGRSGGGRAAEVIGNKRDQVAAYEAFCAELGEPPAEVALAWLLHQPAVTAPITGPRTLGQLESALRAGQLKLDEKALARLDEIFPGPGGTAPEAYAW
jgi:NDP-hexose C3-ketoreductase / dTDP-4-oxo-2-deoxy-alpha-D-pentos-2-ene 2,3-reductase